MTYHEFEGNDGETYGSFEVFWLAEGEGVDEDGEALSKGWYWWACFPGCIPDGPPNGPFASREEAFQDANG